MRCGLRPASRRTSSSRRASVSARCEPRLSAAMAWISSTMTVSTRANSAARLLAVSRMNSDSGVVTSTWGGLRSMGARSACGVSPVRVAVRSGASADAACRGRREQLAQRRLEVLADVVGERLERRDVDHQRPLGQRALGGAPDQAVQAEREGGQGLARPGRRGDQHVAAGPDQRPALDLRLGRLAVTGGEPRCDERVEIRPA